MKEWGTLISPKVGDALQQVITDEELRAEYVRAMGPDLGLFCSELQGDLAWLRHKWIEFQELFAKGPERMVLLNTVASNFFYFLRKLLFEDAMLHLSRLTDPPKTAGRGGWANLTVLALDKMISDPVFRASVRAEEQQVRKACEFARRWRNKRLAHTDFVTLREGHAATLPPVTTANIENAVKSVLGLLSSVEGHYGLLRSVQHPDPWGARSLVYYLQEATRAVDSRHHLLRGSEGL
jgi:hypothetical protein